MNFKYDREQASRLARIWLGSTDTIFCCQLATVTPKGETRTVSIPELGRLAKTHRIVFSNAIADMAQLNARATFPLTFPNIECGETWFAQYMNYWDESSGRYTRFPLWNVGEEGAKELLCRFKRMAGL